MDGTLSGPEIVSSLGQPGDPDQDHSYRLVCGNIGLNLPWTKTVSIDCDEHDGRELVSLGVAENVDSTWKRLPASLIGGIFKRMSGSNPMSSCASISCFIGQSDEVTCKQQW